VFWSAPLWPASGANVAGCDGAVEEIAHCRADPPGMAARALSSCAPAAASQRADGMVRGKPRRTCLAWRAIAMGQHWSISLPGEAPVPPGAASVCSATSVLHDRQLEPHAQGHRQGRAYAGGPILASSSHPSSVRIATMRAVSMRISLRRGRREPHW
jgi:hypothetical protein